MSKFQQKRSIIILASSKDNPRDIYGYCPCYDKARFRSSGWSRRRVYLFESNQGWEGIHHDNDLYGMTGKKRWDSYYSTMTEGYCGPATRMYLHGKITMLRKLIRAKSGNVCGRTPNEYNWNLAKHEAARLQKDLNRNGYKNFEVRCFRVGSKSCPVEIDLTERQEMFYCPDKWNKNRWTNPRFQLKPLEDKQEILTT